MDHVSVSDLRTQLSTTVNRVAFGKERVVLQRQGKDLVALVPLQDLELLERLEDGWLAEEARQTREDSDEQDIPWDQARARLGL
jgi:antitoxin (DNA-binding transcriptional repressor) of toxin-antitoxin stability system